MARRFEKVSFEQFKKDFLDCFDEHEMIKLGVLPGYSTEAFIEQTIRNIWENIKLPKRATKGSAGYDFFAPFDLKFPVGKEVKFPTGIRVLMPSDNALKLYPRSGLGFKFRFQLNNTVGIIDSDYYYSDNEGHMFAKMICDSRRLDVTEMTVKHGEAYMQGIFGQYLLTDDDDADGVRNGGFGSTSADEFGSTSDLKAKSMNVPVKPNLIKKDCYEIGDKVFIKTYGQMVNEFGLEECGHIRIPNEEVITEQMKDFCGTIVTIRESFESRYHIAEDGKRWVFTNGMIEGCLSD